MRGDARGDGGPQPLQGNLQRDTRTRWHPLDSRARSFRPPPKLTFMPISMLERSANGTSRVTSSQRSTAKLHMSAERRLISSAFFCRAVRRGGGLEELPGRSCGRARLGKRRSPCSPPLPAHLLVPPKLGHTSCPDTGRKTSHPPCRSWPSCPRLSVLGKRRVRLCPESALPSVPNSLPAPQLTMMPRLLR